MDVDQLAADMAWVRRLACALLRDNAAADDVVQDAWIVAATHTPTDGRPFRPWLHRVVVNLVRMRRRGDLRRDARERTTHEPAAVPSPDELVERVETQRAVTTEVLALVEPYRSTILLHYVEQLSSAEIARRLGIPDATVRRRLKHALDELRARLRTRDDGPRKGWLAALVPLANPHALGALTMKKVIALVCVVVALLIGLVAWQVRERAEHHGQVASDELERSAGGRTHVRRGSGDLLERVGVLPAWFGQRGVRPRRIAGHVIANGKPVVGALVRLGASPAFWQQRIPAQSAPALVEVAEVRTTADGAFDFGLQPAGNFAVSAESPGLAPASVGVALADPHALPVPDHLVLMLGDCRARLIGTVRDVAGGIANARLQVAGLAGADADATGQFALCLASRLDLDIRVSAAGYGTLHTSLVAMTGDTKRDFVLVPEATIAGVVVDESGHPVSAAVVTAQPLLDDSPHDTAQGMATADDGGHFEINALAPGKYRVVASADHLATEKPIVIVLVAGAAPHDVRVVVTLRAHVTGHVMMNGEPVAGAQVGTGRVNMAGRSLANAETQEDGSFELDGVELGLVEFLVRPYAVRAPVGFVVDRAEVNGVIIDVAPRASVHGQITRHGSPVPDAHVRITIDNAKGVYSDATGAFTIEDLPPGTGVLEASDRMAYGQHPITVVDGQSQQIDIELTNGGDVRGVVIDEAGAPVASVFVRFAALDGDDTCNAMTDVSGAFECGTLSGQQGYRPTVYPTAARQQAFQPASGSQFDLVQVEDGNAVVSDVRLAIKHDQLTIRGQVVDDTGATVPDAHVTVFGIAGGNDQLAARADGDGGFIVEDLAAGTYTLRAHAADGSEAVAQNIPAGASGVTIALPRAGRVEGTLVGFTSPPHVYAESPATDWSDTHEAVVVGDQFTFMGLPAGNYSIDALQGGVPIDGAPAVVESGATVHVTLTARPRTSIEGRVVDLSTGAPLANMWCLASVSIAGNEGPLVGQLLQATTTDATGTFEIAAPIGFDRVTCRYGGTMFSEAGGDFDVTASGTQVTVAAVKMVPPPSNVGFTLEPYALPLLVDTVDPSAKTGLAVGDQLVSIDGVALTGLLPGGAMMLATNHRPGSVFAVQVIHNGASGSLRITAR